jgi:hypothetical protein
MAQWNKNTQDFLNQERSLFEVYNIADHWGNQTDWRPQFSNNNRLKVSPYQTVFFNTFQYGKETDIWDERVVGIGTATHNTSTSNIVMEVGSTAGSKVIRQTKNVMRYVPGRSATLAFAIRLEQPQVGIRRRFGLFDENDGVYFEDDGGTYAYVIRSSVTGITSETRVFRDEWNGEKFDGNGYTGVVADPTKQQMISINYEWYGAGIVQFNWLIKNETIHSHTFDNSNTNPGVWCSTPFLPIRVEIENVTGVAGTHYIYQGSNSLLQEGEPEKLGTLLSFTNPITGTTMPSANTFYPIISLRLKSNDLSAVMLLRTLQAATNDNTNIYWRLIENATLTGGTWVNHPDPNSFMQYNITQTAVSGGTTILNGFVVGGSSNLVVIDEKSDLQLGRSGIGTISDTYTIACASPNTNKSALAVLNWIEQR